MSNQQQGHDADGPEADYPLAPPEALSPEVRQAVPPGCPTEPPDEEPAEPDRLQFSLSELLLLVAAASLFLSLVSTLLKFFPGGASPANFAGMLGLGALLCMLALALVPPTRPIFLVGWWVLVGLYFVASAIALIAGNAESLR